MPGVSEKTAWDFLPAGWSTRLVPAGEEVSLSEYVASAESVCFGQSDHRVRQVFLPADFQPITQLEFA